jgi:type IX secretion system PorP/SprF family membrane protein
MKRLMNILTYFMMATSAFGQDIHFSQFTWSPLNLGPQQTGLFDGDLRLHAIHRRQWAAVTVPYKTFAAGADASLNLFDPNLRMFNAGFQVNHDDAGDGQLRTLDFKGMFAVSIPLGSDSIHFFRGGLMVGYSQRSVDFNALSFDEQFNGDTWDPLAGNGENYNRTRTGWLDAGAGFAWEIRKENLRWNTGLSALHLNKPDQGFYSSEVIRPVLWQFYTGGLISLNNQLLLHPQFIFMQQEKFRAINAGAELRIALQQESGKNYALGLGLFHRFGDAVIPSAAIYWNKIRLGFSYDVNISSLRTVSNGRGGPEFSITYITRKIRSTPQRSVICPVY